MSKDYEGFDELGELERQLREAHSFAPRPGLESEIRARLRPARVVPWAGFSAAAAVLLAVAGVGLLLHSVPMSGGGASTAGPAARADLGAGASGGSAKQVASFGRLPTPTLEQVPTVAVPSQLTTGSYAAPPSTLVVFRYATDSSSRSCSQAGDATPNGYTVIGPAGCWLQADAQAVYGLRPAPSGAVLEYVPVPDGQYEYLEPVYVLPDSRVEPALTADELR